MEGRFFFGEYERWNLGWDNPNPAGLFIAMWIPVMWYVAKYFGNSTWRQALVILLEMVLWFLLCKTYSRGALVAVVAAGVLVFLWRADCFALVTKRRFSLKCIHNQIEPGEIPKSKGKIITCIRVVGVLLLLLQTGFLARIEPKFVTSDASAGNRLLLWKGGAAMIHATPWNGWGDDQSGKAYMHWYQDIDANEKRQMYRGMVNSYLHVAVERGLPCLAVVFAFSMFIVASGLQASHLKYISAVIMVFLLGNVFSTLWIYKHLWWLPLLAAIIILCSTYRFDYESARRSSRLLCTCGGIALLFCFTLWCIGGYFQEPPFVSKVQNGVMVSALGDLAKEDLVILPDEQVLGTYWGKEVRRLSNDNVFRNRNILVLTNDFSAYTRNGIQTIIACGKNSVAGFSLLEKNQDAELILVNPTNVDIPEKVFGRVRVLLPSLDISGKSNKWRHICKEQGWHCQIVKGVGIDIRDQWPSALFLE